VRLIIFVDTVTNQNFGCLICREVKKWIYTNIEEGGENVRLVFINFTESLLAKWEPGGETVYAMRVVSPYDSIIMSENGAEFIMEVFDRIEVYYIDQLISKINAGRDYAKLRSGGTLIWSGTLNSK